MTQPVGGHDHGQHCHCVAEHRPAPLELERHHVWPTYLGGPDEPWNIEWLCPTAHTNAHELLRAMVKAHTAIPHATFSASYEQPVNRHAWHVASVGFVRWDRNASGLDPKQVRVRMAEGE